MLLFQNQAINSQRVRFTLSTSDQLDLSFTAEPYLINKQRAESHLFKSYSVVEGPVVVELQEHPNRAILTNNHPIFYIRFGFYGQKSS